MEFVINWQQALTSSWSLFWVSVLAILPTLFGGVLIFIIGMILAFWLRVFVERTLGKLKFHDFTKSLGVDVYLKKAGVEKNSLEVVGIISQWLAIFIFSFAAVSIFGLVSVTEVISRILLGVQSIFSVILILTGGYIISKIVETSVKLILVILGKSMAEFMARLAKYLVILLSVSAICVTYIPSPAISNLLIQILTYASILTLGIGLGLGFKDVVSALVMDIYHKIKS